MIENNMNVETELRMEYESLKACKNKVDCLSKFTAAYYPQNMCKNRYYNILPNEDSRVKLNALDDGDGDYINANFVGCEHFRKNYILTQAPLPNTMNDLWRMVWQEKVPVVVCLTKIAEGAVQKAHKYWPEEGETMQFGKIIVYHSMTVVYKYNIVIRSFSLWLEGDPLNAIEVFHLHYQDWPDHGTPSSTQPVRLLVSLVSALREKVKNSPSGNPSGSSSSSGNEVRPIVVHCSAGVGRAGTFVAIHMTLSKLEKMALSQPCIKKIQHSIKETVARLRNQREGTVQTVDQYIFIYKVIADFMNIKHTKRSSLKSLETDYILSLSQQEQNASSNNPSSNFCSSLVSPPTPSPSSSSSLSSSEVFFLDILSVRATKCSTDPEDLADLSSSTEVR